MADTDRQNSLQVLCCQVDVAKRHIERIQDLDRLETAEQVVEGCFGELRAAIAQRNKALQRKALAADSSSEESKLDRLKRLAADE